MVSTPTPALQSALKPTSGIGTNQKPARGNSKVSFREDEEEGADDKEKRILWENALGF